MQITLTISRGTLLKDKKLAISQRITLSEVFERAMEEKVGSRPNKKKTHREWTKLAGQFAKTPAQRAETRRIQQVIDEGFERPEQSYSPLALNEAKES
jgi:hypothetical protein